MSNGKWVWNIQPKDGCGPVKLTAGQMEVDNNGVHFCAGPGHCGGLVASFPLGTLAWRDEVPASSAPADFELVAGELARFDLSPRIEIGVLNIACGADPQEVRSILRAFLDEQLSAGPIR